MRTITLNTGNEIGTNNRDGGIFSRRADGTWTQWAGTSQTPVFRSVRQFRRYLRHHYDIRDVRIVASDGWEEDSTER